VFIEPENTGEGLVGSIITPSKEQASIGVVKHNNNRLANQGVEEGDRVMFTDHSKYQLGINSNDERIFRMKDKWIVAKV